MPARGDGEQRGRRIRLQRRKSLWFPQRALFCADYETDRDVLFSNTLFRLSSQRSPKYLPSFFLFRSVPEHSRPCPLATQLLYSHVPKLFQLQTWTAARGFRRRRGRISPAFYHSHVFADTVMQTLVACKTRNEG